MSVDGGDLAGGNQRAVDRGVVVGGEHQFVVVDRGRAVARQIEIGVVREIDGRGLVGRGFVFDAELVLVGEGVGDLRGERARIALFAVGAGVGEDDAFAGGGLERLALPDDLVEAALDAAVERVGRVVDGERVVLAVERELAGGDPIRDAAGRAAEVPLAGDS